MSVRAKFVVNSIERKQHWDRSKGETQTIKLTPVTSGSEENNAFYAATPSGTIELTTLNEEAGKQFELGKEYYIDFTPALIPSN
jgi:hypothetical protein